MGEFVHAEAQAHRGGQQRPRAQSGRAFRNRHGPCTPRLQPKTLLALPNRIFKSENQCALTETQAFNYGTNGATENAVRNRTGSSRALRPWERRRAPGHAGASAAGTETHWPPLGAEGGRCWPLTVPCAGRGTDLHAPTPRDGPGVSPRSLLTFVSASPRQTGCTAEPQLLQDRSPCSPPRAPASVSREVSVTAGRGPREEAGAVAGRRGPHPLPALLCAATCRQLPCHTCRV